MKRCIQVIVFLIIASGIHIGYSQDAKYYFRKGLELYEQGEYQQAIDELLQSTARNNRNAESYYLLTLCYLKIPTFKNKIRAEAAILRARILAQDSTKYLYAFADVYHSRIFFRSVEKIIYKRIINEAPNEIKAMIKLNEIYIDELMETEYINKKFSFNNYFLIDNRSIKPVLNTDSKSNQPEKLKSSELQVIKFSKKILDINPYDKYTLLQASFIYVVNYRYQELKDFCFQLLQKNNNNKYAYMITGLCFYKTCDYDSAYHYYNKAFSLMDNSERAVYENCTHIEPNYEMMYATFLPPYSPERSKKFWQYRDPLFLTPMNERQLEHYTRILESEICFSKYRENIAGWKTSQGSQWIRNGIPLSINCISNEGNYEIWNYEQFQLEFYKKQFAGPGIDFDLTQSLKTKGAVYEYYRYETKSYISTIPYEILQFRGDDEKTMMDVYYSIPLQLLTNANSIFDTYSGKFLQGVFITNPAMNYEIIGDTSTITYQIDKNDYNKKRSCFIARNNLFELTPANAPYNMSIEVIEQSTGNIGLNKDFNFGIFPFPVDRRIRLSDILVAKTITIKDSTQAISRKNINVKPAPFHMYTASEPIYVFFEVYNLIVNENNLNRLKVEYSIEQVPPKENNLKDKIANLFLQKPERISVSHEREGIGRTEGYLLVIDKNIKNIGEYKLTIMVQDLRSQLKTEKSVSLWIY